MKVHQVVLTIIDFDDIGAEEISDVIKNLRYPNHCISPEIRTIETRDIGEWSDDHPLNQHATSEAELVKLFGKINICEDKAAGPASTMKPR